MAILGIDEVGRGPWAGPLVVGGVVLDNAEAEWCQELTDSKKLTAKKRQELSELIYNNAAAVSLGWVSSSELDKVGMSEALRLAARRVILGIKKQQVPFNEIIIDGTVNFLIDTSLSNYVTTLKKADFLIKEVSAASIVAKVARDKYMSDLSEKYPNYHFEKHVGYGTAAHKKAIQDFGLTPEHRCSFKPIKSEKPTTKQLGDRGENVVADFLVSNDHEIIARNHRTKFYEIDIISIKGKHIYFTEVKYRKDSNHGTPLDMITKDKLKQMNFAAEAFLNFQPYLSQKYSPLLAVASVSGSDFDFDEWLPLEN